MSYLSPALLCDFYKLSHRRMYPPGTEVIYSTWTPRGSHHPEVDGVVAFGAQMALAKIDDIFQQWFFEVDLGAVLANYARIVKHSLGDPSPETAHIAALHGLGYLPIEVKALPEGTVTPLRVPHLTIRNTDPAFFWVTNYLETLLSCELWLASTSATMARAFRKLLDGAATLTGADRGFVPFQAHDFSMRGMSSLESSLTSGVAHLTSFVGTDTIPAIEVAELYYHANVETELVGTSIPATEHSVQCAYGDDTEYFKAIISRVHPTGMVSIVSDGYDFWKVMTEVLPALRTQIMERDGRVVIRPDSGDPVKIVCGDPEAPVGTPEHAGAIQCLWDTFGGTTNKAGFKILDAHVGLIYGDAITLSRAQQILVKLAVAGFASTNIVFGVGSYTYQMKTRDSFGWAMKSTLAVINGVEVPIYKDPKTDDGTKKSQKGRVAVVREGGTYKTIDGLPLDTVVPGDLLSTIYFDGGLYSTETLATIRERVAQSLLPAVLE